ncbi:uncharacterized protein B0I36DRAFT_347807 [Microdochium trichocladiopsis]|uniref:Uncharacterized protein n=1 Tax=Microdochium trichocladiopsis TaxID=1682393 RepID=A0A9P8Y8R5_9PEZI|nr:uncharacterized protein B0I36DRAFT_347807 [Microdochium trichocladiopsis]KAH7032626.1 hypothetical protein B0I36DRAFT_347807 [Microdochium trichocladiopsis]
MADQQEDQPPYPSWEELWDRHENAPGQTVEEVMARPPLPRFAEYTYRLFWHFRDDFPACISVALVERVEEDAEPFFKPFEDGAAGDGGTWHEIADWPLTEPKVSSINASSYDLEQLEGDWVATHQEHCGDNGEWVNYGELGRSDIKPTIREREPPDWTCRGDTKCLVRCCGEDRPVGKKGQKVTVTPSPSHDFVTVKDYLSSKFETCFLRLIPTSTYPANTI